jgi:fumarate hydratase subunit alpha
MRTIQRGDIVKSSKDLFMGINCQLGIDCVNALLRAKEAEKSPLAKEIIEELLENARIAQKENIPMCQDTGFAVFFVELGWDVHLGFDLYQAINEGVAQAYKEGFLRASIVKNPINRVNTGNSAPAVVHIELVPGDKIKISAMAKGGGSENMSKLYMLNPTDGIEGVKKTVLETVSLAGPNPCPPIIVGVGIGGTFDKACLLAKKSLLRDIGSTNPDPELAKLEDELLEKINKLGIGAGGYGGTVTCLDVFVDTYPCHIASLPLAINIQCNAQRHRSVVI